MEEEKKQKKENGSEPDKNSAGEEISPEWFEKHESPPEEPEEEFEEELEELLDEEEGFDSRLREFLANQQKEVSLEKMVEIAPAVIREAPQQKREERETEKIDYLIKKEEDELKYRKVGSDIEIQTPNLSPEEAFLEEQKRLYQQIKLSNPEMVKNNEDRMKYVKPEDTIKKDYLSKKRFGEMSEDK